MKNVFCRLSTGPGKSVENENFTKIQGKLREFHFQKIPGFPDYFTTKMEIIDSLNNLDIHDFFKFYSLVHQKFMTIYYKGKDIWCPCDMEVGNLFKVLFLPLKHFLSWRTC